MENEMTKVQRPTNPVAKLKSEVTKLKFQKLRTETNETMKKHIRTKVDDYKKPNLQASEQFDTKFRAEIWNHMVDIIDHTDDAEEKHYLLGEIMKLDIKLFKDYLEINDAGITDAQKRKSESLLEGFTFAFSLMSVSKSSEYQKNEALNKQLYITYENTLNYLNMVEFYLAPKQKKAKKVPGNQLVRTPWSLSVAIKHITLSGMSIMVSAFDTLLQQGFSNPGLTKSVVGFLLVAYMGFHPSFLLNMKMSQTTVTLLPLAARFLSWSKLFSRITDTLTAMDKYMWINAINQSVQQSIDLLERVNHHLTELILQYLHCEPDKEDEAQEHLFQEIDLIVKNMGKGANKLENFIQSQPTFTMLQDSKDEEDGWLRVEAAMDNQLEEIASTINVQRANRKN